MSAGNSKTLNKDDLSCVCVPYVFAALEDRTPEVRKAAQSATLALMIHLDYENLSRTAAKLKPASKNIVQALLEKGRPNLPAVPAPAAQATKPKVVAQSSREMPKKDDESGGEAAALGKVVRPPSKTKVRILHGLNKISISLLVVLYHFFFILFYLFFTRLLVRQLQRMSILFLYCL
jgi:hypothetical protein